MSVPGSNILNQALRVIASQEIKYLKFKSRSTNSVGQYVASYYSPVIIRGSVQSVPRNLFQQMGLDFQKDYKNFFVPQGIIDVDRDVSGDLMVFQRTSYQCLSKTDWENIDGWVQVLAVRNTGKKAC